MPPASSQVPTPTRDPHSRLPKTPIPLFIHVAPIASTLPEYSRGDWKHWTDADRDCQDARNEVLIEESLTTVTFHTDDGCRVATGQWLAPYTNTVVTDPGKLDVDHMVPLGNAHQSGAWGWPAERKEPYANHLGDTQHLIAVTASANRSKGTRGPDEWKPQDESYWCQYAIQLTKHNGVKSYNDIRSEARFHAPDFANQPKLKPRWDVHLSGDDEQLGCAGESLSSVLGE